MADKSRTLDICPWDPDELCKVANGASLPPRKRLLAGLKQNGWLSSCAPYLQDGIGTSCTTGELKVEVDLEKAKPDYREDAFSLESPIDTKGKCEAVVKLVSVKNKRASKRRKSLSVLADCQRSVRNLQPELLKFACGSTIEENVRSNEDSMESLLSSNKEKESITSYKEMADAARAAAAMAEKAAAKAKALALEKAAAAVKAAAIARAALEAIALAGTDEIIEFKPTRHLGTSCQQNRMGEEMKRELGAKVNAQCSPALSIDEVIDDSSGKQMEDSESPSDSDHIEDVNQDEETDTVKGPTVSGHVGAVLDEIKEGEGMLFGSDSSTSLAIAGVGITFLNHQEAKQGHSGGVCTAASRMPPPSDDEKLARQLHRAMNSSPRIARSQACLANVKRKEASPYFTKACTQASSRNIAGCKLKDKEHIHKKQLRSSRTKSRADVKVKSMSAINETLNMLQKATVCLHRDDERAGSFCIAASDTYANAFTHKYDDPKATLYSHETDFGDGKAVFKPESKSGLFSAHVHDGVAMRRNDGHRAVKSFRTKEKLKSRRMKPITGSIQAENTSDAHLSVATYQAGSEIETLDAYDNKIRRYDYGDKLRTGASAAVFCGR